MEFFYVAIGLVVLLLSGDALVRGAVNVSLRLGVPALIVSLTVVAIGTSAPELIVSVRAVTAHAPGIALGNVVGSNIANVMLVLGLPALLVGMNTSSCDSRASYGQMLLGTGLFVILAFNGPLTWVHGALMLALYAGFMAHAVSEARRHRRENGRPERILELEGADPMMRWWRIFLYLLVGLVGLPLGADLLVKGATTIARSYHISEAVIGLSLVALGTSLPELATTVAAAYRKQADVAVGNIIGSNMANLLGILGVSAFFGHIPVSADFLQFDIWVMVMTSLMLAPFVVGRFDMGRVWGGLFMGLYVLYLGFILH